MNQEQWRAKRVIWAALPSPSGTDYRGETRRRADANGPATAGGVGSLFMKNAREYQEAMLGLAQVSNPVFPAMQAARTKRADKVA